MVPPEDKGIGLPARVIAHSTRDGAIGFHPGKYLTATYTVYPSIITEISFMHPRTGTSVTNTFIWADGLEDSEEGWIPTECLDWVGKQKHIQRAVRTIH